MCDAVTVDPPGSRLCLGRAQDLDVLPGHRLLLESSGFEGGGPRGKGAVPDDLAVAELGDEGNRSVNGNTAALATRALLVASA